ncbi:hypothetical protein TSAR_006674 [Trichomalopsis sarcophagae]|uniref:phospholipase A1 n=1 Tax=Trichomalopsis sarcophagae TaxID=543379 RepID=A0A232EFF6_9HYME|nr:hypothetical protein TSAR_006674 [Trichomalopsis sarcophagae]
MMFKSLFITTFLLLLVNTSVTFEITDLIPESNNQSSETSKGTNPSNDNSTFDEISSQFSKLKSKTLNCFGIPVALFANVVEKLFTQETKAEDVRYYFYSRDISGNVTVRNDVDFDINDLPYKSNRKTVIITHGFMSSGTIDWVQEMKDAFLKLEDVNIIVVDWQKGSNTWNYVSASISTKIVGAEIAKLLSIVKGKILDSSPETKEFGSLYLVGHSLGSHISGHASYVLREQDKDEKIKFRIERITGLDPAQPCFTEADLSLKLDKTDAQYVDIIHTNAQNILLLGLGLPTQLGHADYYPNGGKIQLGCAKINTTFWDFLLLPVDIVKTSICSHGRSHELLTDSIHTRISDECRFKGRKWNQKYENISALVKEGCEEDVCPEMGVNSIKYHPDKDGTYFVPTGDDVHYCHVSEVNRKHIKKQLENDEALKNNPVGKLIGHIL